MSVNLIILNGNFVYDPELRITKDGTPCCKFRIAHCHKFFSSKENNTLQEEVVFINATAWNKLAEIIARDFKKGSPILIEGRIKGSEWTGRDKQKHQEILINVTNFTYMNHCKQESNASCEETQLPQNNDFDEPF